MSETGMLTSEGSVLESLAKGYAGVRQMTEELTEGLAPEDMVVQSMTDVSPTKWHLAHTSWFFEQFILLPHLSGYTPLEPVYLYLFNSYYHQAGERHCRDRRGYISRPTVAEVRAYRQYVDEAIYDLIGELDPEADREVIDLLVLGLHHEQQHQELILTDIKHVFSVNPLRPSYLSGEVTHSVEQKPGGEVSSPGWVSFEGGVHEIGHDGVGFAYDNEGPRHRQFLEPFALADRLVTNGEYLEFIEDGGYERPELWLSLGWSMVEAQRWREPFYWEWRDGGWQIFTLGGLRDLDLAEPVSHLTYFEADAFARWKGARLPTEAEWEVAAREAPVIGNFVESRHLHPRPLGAIAPGTPGSPARPLSGIAGLGAVEPAALLAMDALVIPAGAALESAAGTGPSIHQLYGDIWEWTSSSYSPYPGFTPAEGAVGEYNGKFMCNQFVLRGGSCATSTSHIRPTYRNFFPPDATWQFTGLRLARTE